MEDIIELKTKVQEKLKLYGLRPTRARTRIGMMLLDKPKHLSADQVHEKLKQKGLKFDLDPTDQRWLWREARLKDPFNNQIILYYAGENRINPPWRIS